ncbi:hypothetical protein MRB53_010880 [Persea americana]|uniref:Uncharacterized protein n=1 Tax=Persea americana TaxID=3435 RepID=A0ACC2LTU0_PERAE|nr:hypothetical protein MRB53_010880 [Persea americana]
MGRHLPTGNTARPDRYEQSFMAIGSLIYGDKRRALSPLYANWLKAWKEREGCCPLHLLLPVRVRIDGTSPHLPPLTGRMNEEHSPIYAWDQSHERFSAFSIPRSKKFTSISSQSNKRRMEGPGLGDFNGSSMHMDDDDGADGDDANEEGR